MFLLIGKLPLYCSTPPKFFQAVFLKRQNAKQIAAKNKAPAAIKGARAYSRYF